MKNALMICIALAFSIEAKKVIFYHIPKTAGSSTRFLLEMQFDYEKIAPEVTYYEIENKRISDLEKYDFFGGHFFFHSNLHYKTVNK